METGSGVTPRGRLRHWPYTIVAQVLGLGLSLSGAGCILYAHHQAVSPQGSQSLLITTFLMGLPLLACLGLVPLSLSLMIFRPVRIFAANTLVISLVFITCSLSVKPLARGIRHQAFADLAQRSTPLVEAIYQYQADHGSAPDHLTDLVPNYLDRVPGTGMGAYPEFKYETQAKQSSGLFRKEPWALWVPTPTAIIDFDLFVYLPSQDYQTWVVSYGSDNVAEEIGDWAYIYE